MVMSTVSATRSTSHFFGGAKIQGAARRAESGAVGATTNVGAMQCQESTAPLHRSLGGACASTTISDGAAPWNANRSGLENASLETITPTRAPASSTQRFSTGLRGNCFVDGLI